MRNERFFAVEGLDGVGKSTTVGALGERGYTVLTTPTELFKKIRPMFENRDVRVRFFYYLFGVMHAGHQAHGLQRHTDVISDRYLLTTLAAHEAMGLPSKWIAMCKPLLKTIEKPRDTFLITCDEEERMRRLLARGANPIDIKNLEINGAIMEGYFKWADNLGHRLTLIDSTNLSPHDVADVIQYRT
ncbi:MAG: hypothetical protein UR81_C0004G0006 [Candidatus Levybacteria bacterium GW2011_GWB1_35_5]|nr:MAG: hypothetical protein UR81_C0004G0006 [Candidatus Levybacteria bacterium GW2011_GWB1_35_5]